MSAFETVACEGLYDGIDLLTWGQRDSLKYEFHVAPGADYRQIQVSYEGIGGLWLDDAGELHVQTALGELIDEAPYIYQQLNGRQVEVAGDFTLIDAHTYTFDITGPYDASAELVIDPDLAWSTYLGGSDADNGSGIAVDAAGNLLVAGSTSSPGWVSGGFETSLGGGRDAFVVKLSPSGSHLWSTYLGGTEQDSASEIAVDAAGNALVAGTTRSPGWVSGGFDTSYNGNEFDAFVAKLSPTGGHLWSTYLGGSYTDDANSIAVDAAGNALVTGLTESVGWVSGGFDTSHNGGNDVFVAKLSSSGSHLWSTYLGGSDRDDGESIAVDAAGNALVTGVTQSPGWASGGFDTSYNGGFSDAFVAKLSSSGDHLWTTYLGGSDSETGFGIAVDAADNAMVTGHTYSPGWVSGGFDAGLDGTSDAFVVKLSPTGGHLWSTYLGGSSGDLGRSIAVDTAGNALVAGSTVSPGWVSGGSDTTYNGGEDIFVAQLSPAGDQLWSTYLGGSSFDRGPSIAVDAAGNALVTGSTSSPGWISGGFDTSLEGTSDAFVARISEVPLPTAEVVGQHVFYNNSIFDGPLFGLTDDDAIAPDKVPLLPGTPTSIATSANYTSFSRGINGIMVDIADLAATPTTDDFAFRVGNDNDPAGWSLLTATPTVTVRRSAGTDDSDRVTIVWDDGAIRNTWLQVTVKAGNLGLDGDDVFYFGNAVAEAGNSDADAKVTVTDLLLARNNPRDLISSPADLTFPFDYDRDGQVDAVDVLLARNNRTSFLDELKLVDLRGERLGARGEGEEVAGSPGELAWLSEFESNTATAEREAAATAVDLLLATFME